MALAGSAPWQVLIPDLTDVADINVGFKQFYEGYSGDSGVETHIVALDGRLDTVEAQLSGTGSITFKDNYFYLADNTDTNKKVQFQLSTITSGTIELRVPPATDTLVGIAATQTLTNKTLTAAVINSNSQIDNSPIGSSVASTGRFTTIEGTSTTDTASIGTGALIVAGGASIAKDLRVGANLRVATNLYVDGSITTTTTINSDSPIISVGVLNPTSDDNKDRGVQFNWHNGSVAKTGFFGFDDSTGYFTFVPDATIAGQVVSGTKGTIDVYFSGSNINAGTVSASYIDSAIARLSGPTFTGIPAAPTAATDTNTTQIATTAFVIGQGYLKSSTASSTYAPLASPTFTGTVTLPLVTAGYVKTTSGGVISSSAAIAQADVTNLTTDLSAKAPLASPTFTGTVTTPLTTAGYVKTSVAGVLSSVAAIAQADITNLTTDLSAKAPLASPTFTGTITTPLSTAGYVKTSSGGVLSSVSAIAQADVTNLTTDLGNKAPIASPTFTGTATSPVFAASGLTGATQASRYVGATTSGAPASGTFSVGDFIVDRTNGKIYICTTAGTPGTWTMAGGTILTQTYATALPSAGSYPEGTVIVRY